MLGGLALGNGGFDLVVWGREGGRKGGRECQNMEGKTETREEKISNGLLLLSPSPSLPPSLPPSYIDSPSLACIADVKGTPAEANAAEVCNPS